jgi:hypothetical protein
MLQTPPAVHACDAESRKKVAGRFVETLCPMR